MFMAILNDTYSEVKEEVENRREDFQVNDNFYLFLYHNVQGYALDAGFPKTWI